MLKIYIKKGNKSYKENKLLRELNEVFEKKITEDPTFEFKPAENFAELQKLHGKYCIEDANVVTDNNSSNDTPVTDESTPPVDTAESGTNPIPAEESSASDAPFVDPMNREEPNVRDYVTKEGFTESGAESGPAKTSWDEPTSFGESFEIPSDDPAADSSTGKSTDKGQDSKPNQPARTKQPSINPDFDEMSAGKKKRSTKKFAKYVVETVCMLAEKGFVWYANKDINEAKLAEYELNDTMDLNLLLEMEDGQSRTVKQFFLDQCQTAEHLSKIDEEEKQDLILALAEVLMEKGVAPTPMQELALIGLKIFGGQAIALLQLKSQTNSLIQQLKDMKNGESTYEEQPAPAQQSKSPAAEQPVTHTDVPSADDDPTNDTEPAQTPYEAPAETDANPESPILSQPQNTLE